MAQTVKRLSTMWETWVWSLGWEDFLEKEMETHSSTLALKIPWTEELGAGYYPWCRRVGHDWATSLSLNVYRFFFSILNINLYIQLSLHEKVLVHSVRVSLHSHGLVRLLCPWNSPGKNIGVDSHSLLQGIFPTQVLNPSFPHCRQIFYLLSHQGSPHENLV